MPAVELLKNGSYVKLQLTEGPTLCRVLDCVAELKCLVITKEQMKAGGVFSEIYN